MKLAILATLLSLSASASTYTVPAPSSGSACPSPGCLTVALGGFSDTYNFTVEDEAIYFFQANGNHWHRQVNSGRLHINYTESLTITDAVVVDSNGAVVMELEFAGYVSALSGVTPDQQDTWTGSVDLPPGNYSLVISAVVSGNRPGNYEYEIGQ